MMHKRKAVSMQTHVVIKQEGLCAIRQQRPRQAEVHRVPGQLTHGGAWGPGLRPDEDLMRLLNNYVEPRGHKLEEFGK